MENINEHIGEIRELVKSHLSDFLKDLRHHAERLKILIMPKDERMRELISLQAIDLSPIEAVRYYLRCEWLRRALCLRRMPRPAYRSASEPCRRLLSAGAETGLPPKKPAEE